MIVSKGISFGHLGSVVQHGINDFIRKTYTFSTATSYPRQNNNKQTVCILHAYISRISFFENNTTPWRYLTTITASLRSTVYVGLFQKQCWNIYIPHMGTSPQKLLQTTIKNEHYIRSESVIGESHRSNRRGNRTGGFGKTPYIVP